MPAELSMSSGLVRTRRTAAIARAVLGLAALVLAIGWPPPDTSSLAVLGFAIVLASGIVQLMLPSSEWVVLEESLASVSAVLVIGLGPDAVSALTVLWLAAVAAGVLARGGRAYWIGRAVLVISLAMPVIRDGRCDPHYACVGLAAIALLLTCGRATQELRNMLERARYDADHDGLTGALSRSAFRAALDGIAGRSRTEGPAALLLLDLDNFGQVNKTSGHAAGDTALQTIVARLRAVLGPEAVIGRLGGDEFAIIARAEDPVDLGRRLLAAIESCGESSGPNVQASIGVAVTPRDGDDADGMLRAVDVALRVAKRSARPRVSAYAGESFSQDGSESARETLERLIAGDGLRVVVQPIVSLRSGAPHAYEALARFETAGPLHWFALADEFGMRDRLELACLRAALAYLPHRPKGTLLTVNLSGPLLLDPRTSELLLDVGDLSGLILELTENSLVDDGPRLHTEISRLISLGVRFAVDDMGAGYSGLRQITTVRPSYLKLDRSLISGIDTDPGRGALVTALLGYAERTGGHLVAEGIETEAELETLAALGVDLVQGFLLGRPAPPWPQVTRPCMGEAPVAPAPPRPLMRTASAAA
jgi:diguanylate cyclase (GGDEF)-like protein